MSAPEKLRLKRKRQDDPLEALVLAEHGNSNAEAGESTQKRLRYRLLNDRTHQSSSSKDGKQSRPRSPAKRTAKRLFHLLRVPDSRSKASSDGQEAQVPVFEERSTRTSVVNGQQHRSDAVSAVPPAQSSPLRRPGKGSTVGSNRSRVPDMLHKAQSYAEHQHNMQALADELHKATLAEMAEIPRPSSQSRPKMSPKQAKERHDRNLASRETTPSEDVQMTDTGDFVYDTYVLAQTEDDDEDSAADLGYLIIDEEDEDYWQLLIGAGQEGELEEADSDDENAEDHYAADYPEDEDGLEDEDADSQAYIARGEEEWNLAEDNSSDDDTDTYGIQKISGRPAIVHEWERIIRGNASETHE